MRTLQLILAAGAALGLGLLAFSLMRGPDTAALASGLQLQQPRALPEFSLIDQNGDEFGNAQLQGKWHLFFAGFTHCPDFCPTTMTKLKGVETELGSLSEALQVVLFSVDPQRDQPEKLAQYVHYFSPEFIGVTGAQDQVDSLAAGLGLAYAIVGDAGSEDYTVDHSAALVLLNPQGRIAAYFSPPHQIPALAADLRLMIEQDA